MLTTSTYEARALGVFSAMGTMKAAQLAPDAILLPVDFDEYRRYSRMFKAAVREIAPKIEDRGIDEIYIDLTEIPGALGDMAAPSARSSSRRCAKRWPLLLGGHHAQQAAVQAGLGTRQSPTA